MEGQNTSHAHGFDSSVYLHVRPAAPQIGAGTAVPSMCLASGHFEVIEDSDGDWLVDAVRVNGEGMTMTKGETELELIPFVEGGELLVLWQLHREGLGQAVELTTGQLSCMQQYRRRLLLGCQSAEPHCHRHNHEDHCCDRSGSAMCYLSHTSSTWSTVGMISRHAQPRVILERCFSA